MTVAYGASSTAVYSTSGGTTVTPTIPTGVATGNLLLMWIGQKPSTANSGSATVPTGWSLVRQMQGQGGYTTTLGADTGNTNLYCFAKYATSGDTAGSGVAVTLATNNIAWATISRYTKTLNEFAIDWADGAQAATPTSTLTITMGQNPGITAGDIIASGFCTPTDIQANEYSAETIIATGATIGTTTEIAEPLSATGNQVAGVLTYTAISSGTATAAPQWRATVAGTLTNVRGPAIMVRIREVDTSNTAIPYVVGNATEIQGAGSGSATVSKPIGVVSGNMLVALMGFDNDGVTPPATPSGWTLAGYYDNGAATQIQGAVYYMIAGGSEPDSYTFTVPSGAEGNLIVFKVANGATLTTPTYINDTSTTSHVAPDQTATKVNQLYVGFWNIASNFTAGLTLTPPSTMYALGTRESLIVWFTAGVAGAELLTATGSSGTRTAVGSQPGQSGDPGLGASFLVSTLTVVTADSTAPLVVGATSTAFLEKLATGAQTVVIAASATAFKATSADSASVTVLNGTATATRTAVADTTSTLILGATSTATRTAAAAGVSAIGITGSATASVIKGFSATAPLVISTTATATPTRLIGGTAPLVMTATSAAIRTATTDASAPLTISASASSTASHPIDASAPLALTATATANTLSVKTIDGAQTLVVGSSATATRNSILNAAPVLSLSASATASVSRSADAAALLVISATATATPTRNVAGAASIVLSSTATAFNTTTIGATMPTVLAASASMSIAGQTVAMATIAVGSTASATVNHTLGATAPLVLGVAGTMVGAHPLNGSSATVLTATASSAVSHPFDSSAPIGVSATASATVTHFAGVNADAPLALAASSTLQRSTAVDASSSLALTASGSAYGTRPLTSTAVTSVLVTASATVVRGGSAVAVTTITAGAQAFASKRVDALGSLVMATTAVMNSNLLNGGYLPLSLNASATATVTVISPIDLGDAFMLETQRELTTAYIAENPSTIILRPRERERTSTGGYILTAVMPRDPQTMRIIEGAGYADQGVARTETGFMRERTFQLMGEWNALIEVDDRFFYDDVLWIVRSFMPENGYETRALVERIGA